MCMKNCERCPDEHTSHCIKYQPTEENLRKQADFLKEHSVVPGIQGKISLYIEKED